MPKTALIDRADWTGVKLQSIGVGATKKHDDFVFNGIRYVTEEEWMMAQLLTKAGVAFTPNVSFRQARSNERRLDFTPDFVFNKSAYVWKANRKEVVIHGIEVKGDADANKRNGLGHRKAALLWERRHINILVLANQQVYWRYRQGTLPITPLVAAGQ